ncbi:RNA polymerase sigma factor [Edaphobacter modestus]|uniref:RNA polymerase sigma-70 factor (ECF subfamily) n=1 Tax=Edaphobacter modestus TaxID=388466 RepID=A0A4Q7YYD9_9BACT|nr:sigma-70 family RNA polymerase sigma factor [Edaphobacter modestus]RZU42494.1 RNA polymerase sigma-70 factor (ECF subfamily) [Edaphobacter modestus]
MGVLSIALPAVNRRTSGRTTHATLPHHIVPRSMPDNPGSIPVAPVSSRGKLVRPLKPFEGMLERTPEQEAAQEAVARLVRQCIAGDAQAWQQLVVSQHRRIYAICYRFTGSSSDAEDLTQDVFLKLYRNLASFDLHKGSFQTWITTLARNLLVDHFRRTRLDRASDSLDATFDGEEDGPTMADRLADTRDSQEQQFASLELKTRIQEALKQLSPELREAVILRDLEDMDYKDIAQVLRIPEGTVKSRISRGRGELARLLQRIEKQRMM